MEYDGYMRSIKNFFQRILISIFRAVLSLRYRIEIKGFKDIETLKGKGVLFLPNHPAEMDPVILMSRLFGKFRIRPLIYESYYYKPGLHFFINFFVDALPLPSMENANQWKLKQIEKLKDKIIRRLDKGDSFLIYPSGRLASSGEEKIGGASLVHQLLEINPEMEIVLIRTTGLWGSSFSRAITGYSPDFGKSALHGILAVLKNLIFFTPRRDVLVEFEIAGEDFPRRAEKKELNEWLEDWYNKGGPEPLTLVSYSIWKKEIPEVAEQKKEEEEEVPIPEEIKAQVLGYISKLTKQPVTNIQTDLHLSNDLGLDSLDISQIKTFLEERFEIPEIPQGEVQTVQDILQIAAGVKEFEEQPKPSEERKRWPKEGSRKKPEIPDGKTIPEVFFRSCERMGNTSIACADALSGVLTYGKLKRAVLVLSLEIKKMPGENIGILLPSSVAAYTAILATLVAGKTPVMLNWTAGYRNVEHAAEVCNLKTVLSSFRFLSRLDQCDLGTVDELLIYLEKLRRKISYKNKLKGLLLSFKSASSLIKKIPKKLTEKSNAVVIFTSGTETFPKGVPLSHYNILTNQRSALSTVNVGPENILYGVLPPFHSFGFSVTGILPLLAGMKVCYAPDPTDSRGLANDIKHWEVTFFCCAPSFILGMLRVAKEEQLKTLQLIVTGAEKAPVELYDTIHAKGKTLLEGYGISECGPIVTLQREGEPQIGVGKPLPGVEICIIDSESEEVLGTDQEGEVCIIGPNVFKGYLGEERYPFIEIEGRMWYRSGDRGIIDPSGNLIITGRLSRFLKIGGEMVSLGGLEENLIKIAQEKGWTPREEGPFLAVVGAGFESEKPQIIVFSTIDLDREELNRILKERGHGRLVKIAEVRKVDEMPVTGTGKIHYRVLEEMV